MKLIALFATTCLLFALQANGCAIMGQLFCDKCWDGQYTSGTDTYLSGVALTVTCTVKTAASVLTFSGSTSATSQNGAFSASINNEAAFRQALYPSGDSRKGLLSGSSVTGCTVTITSTVSSCPTLALNDGSFRTDGKAGNGFTSTNVKLVPIAGSIYADIFIGNTGSSSNSVSLTPIAKPSGCPASPPPPPGVKGDPHFKGADGSHFDFTGLPGEHYCLVSDSHLHINAYYGGRYAQWGNNPNKPLTWIRSVGMLWAGHTVQLEARRGGRWQYDGGYMARIQVDGTDVALTSEGDSALLAGGTVEVTWAAAGMKSADDLVDVYTVRLGQAALIRLTLRPEVALLRTPEDGVVHFNMEFPKIDSSAQVHGVLGQTFRPDHHNRLAKQKLEFSTLLNAEVVPGDNAEGFLDGQVADYRASSLLTADCQVARYSAKAARDQADARGVQLTTGAAVSTVGVKRSRKVSVF